MSHEVFQNYINGQWVGSSAVIENINPSDTSDVVGHYAKATPEDCLAAIAAANTAFADWSQSGLEQRKLVLDFIGAELIARSAEIGEILAREEGKTRAEGVGEVYRSGQFFQYYGAEALRLMGENTQSVRPGVDVEVHREALGVVGIVTPWNFPMAVAAWKVAPALAYGNAVVLKPAELVPASAWILADIISRSGLPAGAFNLVMGSGRDVGETLCTSPDIQAVTFTGSVAVGRHIARNAIDNMARVQLEMGSKNALVVLDDADMDVAVNCALAGGYFGTGQKCTASSRIIVQAGIHDAFVEKLSAAVSNLVVGHALGEGSQIGPVVDARQLQQNLDFMQIAKDEGAELVVGGERLNLDTEGFFMSPALFVNTSNQMRINREEVFGPIACVIKVDSYEQALEVSNDSDFGLTSGIITNSLKYAGHFKRHSQSGCVMVNLPTAGTDYHVPFGGRKSSSYGPREQGSSAREFYTIVKTNYSKPY
ncbi:aldehyde dehydrogenase family protein [SAR92 clade bacterium H455]|uniref:Aldehyde dehydrogenase family protein n=1 Tax=SAR92 clade bacterium H455 TaxID=2974818 RepID=A0ABY5TS62_9GAMM|nr:aldehyde dehydrogenase family protein [SAR92 clade bacterium H455]